MQIKLSYTQVLLYPSSGCYTCPFSPPLGPKIAAFILVMGVTASCQHLESFAGRSVRFMLIVSSLPTVGSTWIHFSLEKQLYTYLFLHWFAVPHYTWLLLYVGAFVGIRYCSFILFVTPESSFVQLEVCISLTDCC